MKKNKIGIGSLSLLLFIVGCLFAFTFNDICIGDNILTYIGLKAWSNGNDGIHYTMFYSLLFFIPASILGYKFKNDFGAKIGKALSNMIVAMIIIYLPFFAFV